MSEVFAQIALLPSWCNCFSRFGLERLRAPFGKEPLDLRERRSDAFLQGQPLPKLDEGDTDGRWNVRDRVEG